MGKEDAIKHQGTGSSGQLPLGVNLQTPKGMEQCFETFDRL